MQRVRTIMYACLASPLLCTIAEAAIRPPEPSLRKAQPAWMGYAIMFVFLVVILSISLMSSKRGHQD